VNLIKATEDSINTAFVDLTTSIPDGPQKVMETMNAMGIPPAKAPRKGGYGMPDHTPGLEPFAGIALGSATVSPINMANGYATIANGGRFHAPYIIEKVLDADGEVLYDHSVSDEQVIDAEQGADIAADVSYAMQQVVQAGSGTVALGLGRPAAGKTGTATVSNGDVSSSWFTGFTPQMATSVMYVRGKGTGKLDGWLPASDDGREGYFGGNYPAKTWTEVMTLAMEGVEEEDFPEPAYVDGEAPSEGHSPTVAPSPTKKPTPKPSPTDTEEPTESPTDTAPPPTAPPTTAPPTTAPPTTEPPTTAPPTTAPPTTAPPTTAPPTVSSTASPSRTAAALQVDGLRWAWWDRMRW
jgi:membrane peptidoglycan carboxypeptidase